jgi:hypothetical protein
VCRRVEPIKIGKKVSCAAGCKLGDYSLTFLLPQTAAINRRKRRKSIAARRKKSLTCSNPLTSHVSAAEIPSEAKKETENRRKLARARLDLSRFSNSFLNVIASDTKTTMVAAERFLCPS